MTKEQMITYGLLTTVTEQTVDDLNVLLRQLTSDPDEMTVGRIQEILDAGTLVLTAESDGRIVGTASVLVMKQMRRYKGWLEDIVVDHEYRGRGIARRLIEMSADVARNAGCENLNMTSKPGREDAMRLYESVGYKRRNTNVFRLDLSAKH